jgi:fatty-acid desaturase
VATLALGKIRISLLYLAAFLFLIFAGEGWHNYHHVYPWDYKTAESPRYWFNPTLLFIDVAAMLGNILS